MDRALDEVIGEPQRDNRTKGGRNRGRDNRPRNGPRKTGDEHTNIDDDWIHDKFDDDDESRGSRRPPRRGNYRARESPEADLMSQGAKIRVENVHYDLTEEDLTDLFERIAPLTNLTLTYDRAGRSLGTAYVTYRSITSARAAIRDFDGANANGQPIRLSIVPSGPSGGRSRGRGQADGARPGRSLFERIQDPRVENSRGRNRSRSPRRSDVTKPAPDGIDRYVPGGGRSRSPPRRRNVDRGDGRNNSRRTDGPRRGQRRDDSSRQTAQGRPRMTQEDLDKDMDAYWGSKKDESAAPAAATESAPAAPPAVAPAIDDDIDMIE